MPVVVGQAASDDWPPEGAEVGAGISGAESLGWIHYHVEQSIPDPKAKCRAEADRHFEGGTRVTSADQLETGEQEPTKSRRTNGSGSETRV